MRAQLEYHDGVMTARGETLEDGRNWLWLSTNALQAAVPVLGP